MQCLLVGFTNKQEGHQTPTSLENRRADCIYVCNRVSFSKKSIVRISAKALGKVWYIIAIANHFDILQLEKGDTHFLMMGRNTKVIRYGQPYK